ncbi:MAG: Methyl-accepting chemotaxis protein/methyl-accepting chemotaxis protein-2, aspartate sensor receptor [Ramlibacter sp.]|nr:Methyl-accepting chemotaxis protein/methyl-accepting chemotaxis protein-2, aspartate sensor receptor [Ramlibacter sp.]
MADPTSIEPVQGEPRARPAGLLRSVTIRVRLIGAFSALLVLLLATAGIGAWQLVELHRVAKANQRIERVLGEWRSEIRADSDNVAILAGSDDAAVRQMLAPRIAVVPQRISDLHKELASLQGATAATASTQDIATQGRKYLDARQGVLDRKAAGEAQAAATLPESALQPAARAYLASLGALSDFYAGDMADGSVSVQGRAETGLKVMVGVCLVGAVLQFFFCWLVTASVVRPIRVAAKIAAKVAGGDLTVKVRADGRDEGTQLLQSLAGMIESLRSLVGQVVSGAHTVTDTSARIAHGNLDLSQRTEEQASTLEQTASSLEELTSTVAQNADNARKAARLALGASEVARKGGEAVGEVVSTMTGISQASQKISDIVGVIDGIAFQTNILALNAAVEAARAGEQGRGFAVVAAEVRSLAQRSAAAAREIKGLIADSASKVDAGARLVDAAGRTMQEIVVSVEQVTDLIGEIAASSQEQSSGIAQVNKAVGQMDKVVQQNAALVEEASAATASMRDQAGALLQLVSRFKLGTGQAAVASLPAIAPMAARRAAPAAAISIPPIRVGSRQSMLATAGWRDS